MDLPRLDFSTATTDDKHNILKILSFASTGVSLLLVMMSFSVSELWGYGPWLQILTSALLYLGHSILILNLLNDNVNGSNQNQNSLDFLGGVSVTLSLILLQNGLTWNSFGNGLGFSKVQKEGEELMGREKFPSGRAESTISSLCLLGFCLNTALCYSVLIWKQELLQSSRQWNPVNETNGNNRFGEINAIRKSNSENFGNNRLGEGVDKFQDKFSFINSQTRYVNEDGNEGDDFGNYQNDESDLEESRKLAASVF